MKTTDYNEQALDILTAWMKADEECEGYSCENCGCHTHCVIFYNTVVREDLEAAGRHLDNWHQAHCDKVCRDCAFSTYCIKIGNLVEVFRNGK